MNDSPFIWAEVDLSAIAHNVRELRRLTRPQAQVMAVVKANGYGHGAVEVARTALANGAEWLGVARLAEAIHLREAGFGAPILVFGYTPPADAGRLIDFDLRQSVYSLDRRRAPTPPPPAARGRRIRVHLKVDTGMGRLGLVPAALSGKTPAMPWGRISSARRRPSRRLPGLDAEGIFTHFAASDSADTILRQAAARASFSKCSSALRAAGLEFAVRHAANSAGRHRAARVPPRPGPAGDRALRAQAFGRSRPHRHLPAAGHGAQDPDHPPESGPGRGLRQLRDDLPHPAPTVIATIPAGYADGYRRLLSSKGEMLVGGRRVPVVGRVCMDLTMLDVGAVPDASVEDEVVIFGPQGERVHLGGRPRPRARHHQLRNRLRRHRPGAAGLSKQSIIMNRHLLFLKNTAKKAAKIGMLLKSWLEWYQ